ADVARSFALENGLKNLRVSLSSEASRPMCIRDFRFAINAKGGSSTPNMLDPRPARSCHERHDRRSTWLISGGPGWLVVRRAGDERPTDCQHLRRHLEGFRLKVIGRSAACPCSSLSIALGQLMIGGLRLYSIGEQSCDQRR